MLLRLKDGADPKVLAWYGPDGTRHTLAPPPGRHVIRLGEACEFYDEPQSEEALDQDVELRDASGRTGVMRVVCVPFEGRDRYYLTTPPRMHFTPHDVAQLYGVRWEVELYLKDPQGGALSLVRDGLICTQTSRKIVHNHHRQLTPIMIEYLTVARPLDRLYVIPGR